MLIRLKPDPTNATLTAAPEDLAQILFRAAENSTSSKEREQLLHAAAVFRGEQTPIDAVIDVVAARTITKGQYLQLLGLLALSARYLEQLNAVQEGVEAVLGITDDHQKEHCMDAVFSGFSPTELLERLHMVVKPAPPGTETLADRLAAEFEERADAG